MQETASKFNPKFPPPDPKTALKVDTEKVQHGKVSSPANPDKCTRATHNFKVLASSYLWVHLGHISGRLVLILGCRGLRGVSGLILANFCSSGAISNSFCAPSGEPWAILGCVSSSGSFLVSSRPFWVPTHKVLTLQLGMRTQREQPRGRRCERPA
jgi:hypothetical protein